MRNSIILLLTAIVITATGWMLWSSQDSAPGSRADDHGARTTSNIVAETLDNEQDTKSADPDTARERVTPSPSQITGRIVDQQGPLAGIEVKILHETRKLDGYSGWHRRFTRSAWQGVTDHKGDFSVWKLQPGRYWAAATDLALTNDLEFFAFDIKDDQQIDLGELRVPAPGALHGRIIDELGMPLAGVRVYRVHSRHTPLQFNLTALPGSKDADPNVLTDAEGRFTFDSLVPGKHGILADIAGYVEGETACAVEAGADFELPDLALRRGEIAQGRVVAADGTPIEGALVVPLRPGDRANLRRATRTESDGSFILLGLDIANIQARAEGYAFQNAGYDSYGDADEPLVITLQPEITLRGRVEGLSTAKGFVRIDPEDLDSLSPSVQPLCWVPLPVEPDGSFVIKGLVQAKYEIIASADPSGNRRSEPMSFELVPDMAPLSVTLLAQSTIEVVVRDDLGKVLGGAELFTWPSHHKKNKSYSWPTGRSDIDHIIKYSQREDDGGQQLRTDAEGRAFPLSPDESISIAARHEGHLAAAASFEPGGVPGRIELVLPRAGKISGSLDDLSEGDLSHLSVAATPLPGQGDDLPETAVITASVDAQGHYLFEAIRPGNYRVAIQRWTEMFTNIITKAGRKIPLLGSGTDTRNVRRIELLPGDHVEVNLEVAPLGSISGRVLLHGQPMAGVHVFEATLIFWGHDKQPAPDHIQGQDAHEWRRSSLTDAEGKFEFAYMKPESWQFLVQHPKAHVPGKPIAIQANDFALDLRQDLILEAAEVRGQIDLLSIPDDRQRYLRVSLVSARMAENDPFRQGPFATNESSQLSLQDGKFSFPFLGEGDWYVRLIDRVEDLLMQVPVHTDRNELVDLGTITLPRMVRFHLQVDTPKPGRLAGIRIRRTFGDDPWLIFVRSLLVKDGHLREGFQKGVTLEPGNYHAELFWSQGGHTMHSDPLDGESADLHATFEVHADGTVTPSKLVFN